jgi:aminodeoxyfutalosine synthase
VTEFHIVGGLHPDLPLEYFEDLVRGLKQRFPQVHVKAFTMVEIAFFAKRAKLSIRDTLVRLRTRASIRCPAAARKFSATACATSSATTRLMAANGWIRRAPRTS